MISHVTHNKAVFAGIALGLLLSRLLLPLAVGSTGFDWDEVMMLSMGFAGLAYVVADLKRERRLDEQAHEILQRVTRLECADENERTADGEQLRLLETWIERVDAEAARADVVRQLEARIERVDDERRELATRVIELGDRLITTEATHIVDTKRLDQLEERARKADENA